VRERFCPEDLELATDFAHRLAMALDNALLYRKAERAIEMRDDVLAIVSHDLRTPLGVILMQAETLGDDENLAKVGSSIEQAAQQMNRLIGDLLDASAINAGKLTLEATPQSPGEILMETAEMFRIQAARRSLDLVTEVADELPPVRCDRERIIQVLANLVSNAIKYTPRGGMVRVSASRDHERVCFEVDDTGDGIPPDQVPHLFDRFWRARGIRGGAGLGLFIARGIVTSHGASLGVASEVGQGSRFFFSLATE
jgi:signal transduction histidine kinase